MKSAASYQGTWRSLGSTLRSNSDRLMWTSGSAVAGAAMPAIVAWFGKAWMEGGWLSFTFHSPVYDHELVREEADFDANRSELRIRVVTDKGRAILSGNAGLGLRDVRNLAAEEVAASTVRPARVAPGDVVSLLQRAGDHSTWYQGPSPWGESIVPPIRLMRLALDAGRPRLQEVGAQRPLWTELALSVAAPLRYDRDYELRQEQGQVQRQDRVMALGFSFQVNDNGAAVAFGRHLVKWTLPPP